MKSYTDIEQSKKLAEILPLESADMCYIQDLLAGGKYGEYKPYVGDLFPAYGQDKIKCWSLAALLNILPNYHITNNGITGVVVWSMDIYSKEHPNLIDACVAMIELLHKQKLL